jgi:hypothetical protein
LYNIRLHGVTLVFILTSNEKNETYEDQSDSSAHDQLCLKKNSCANRPEHITTKGSCADELKKTVAQKYLKRCGKPNRLETWDESFP